MLHPLMCIRAVSSTNSMKTAPMHVDTMPRKQMHSVLRSAATVQLSVILERAHGWAIYTSIEIRIEIKTICAIYCTHGWWWCVRTLFVLLRALREFNYAFQCCAHIARLSPAAGAMAHLFIHRKSIEHVPRAHWVNTHTTQNAHITSHVRHRQPDCQCEKGTRAIVRVLSDGHMAASGMRPIQMIQTTTRPRAHV